MTHSLEEYARICSLIASCNDIINGKFILAYNKIATLLKNLTASQEVYNLLATHLTNFDFEREFSHAQLRGMQEKTKFALPPEPEKILPFVFCILVNINNRALDLDGFIKEFFPTESANHNDEFKRFATEVIMPFRDLIARAFEVPLENVGTMNTQPLKHEENQEELMKKAEELEKAAHLDEETLEELEQRFEEDEEFEEEYDDDNESQDISEESVQDFFEEITSNCGQMLQELNYEKRLKEDVRDDIEYICECIIFNCEQEDLKNTIALITALDYVVKKSKTLKIYTREMKNVLVEFYGGDEDDDDDYDD